MHALTKSLPLEWTICLGHQMEVPYMGIMHPLIHTMEVQILTWFEPTPEPPELLMTMTMPLEIKYLFNLISEAFIDTLLSIPINMLDRIRNLNPNAMPISFLVWNVQGASQAFLAAFKEILRINKPSVVALVEAHMGSTQADFIASKFEFGGHLRIGAQGFSGGIWVYWRSEIVTVHSIHQSNQNITMETTRTGELPWYFSAIYTSPNPVKRHELWASLKDLASKRNHPLLLGGDFNDTRYDWERSTCCEEVKRRAIKFNEWVDDMELVELEFSGLSHTWARGNSEETRKSARLDRALCNAG
ncbi:RNA-directed DNA polymerase from mobile element jockey [Bienertia sinuspersici]